MARKLGVAGPQIRVHFDRGCAAVRAGDHYHRMCTRYGYAWVERCSEGSGVVAAE